MKIHSAIFIFFYFILSSPTANAQTLQWVKDDSTFNSGSGVVLALPHSEMFVVDNCASDGFAVFKYDKNGNVIFQKNFPQHSVHSQLLAPDGNLLVSGSITDTLGFVSLIDTNGNQVWEASIAEPNYTLYPADLAVDTDGNSYFVASRGSFFNLSQDIALYKINTGGSLDWSRYFGDTTNYFGTGKIAITPGRKILIAFNEQDVASGSFVYFGYLQLLKYDSSGILAWHHEITDNSGGYDITMKVSDLSVATDESIYVCGNASSLDLGIQRDYPYVTKLDSAGNKIWLREIFDHGTILTGVYANYYAGALAEDGSYYAAGRDTLLQIVVVKFSSDSDVLWIMNQLPMYNTSSGTINNLVMDKGHLYAAGMLNDLSSYTDYLIIASNDAGVIQWTVRYNSQGNDYNDLASLALDEEDNVLVSGATHQTGAADFYTTTVKYSNFLSGIFSPSENYGHIKVFPNPAISNITISTASPSMKLSSLSITDEYGQEIEEIMMDHLLERQIDIHSLSPGIYFLHLVTEEKQSYTRKFVKQ